MKITPLIFIALLYLLDIKHISAQHTFTLKCNIEGAANRKIYLANTYGGHLNPHNPYTMDSIIPQHDTFHFRGSFNDYKYYSLLIDTVDNFYPFVIDTGVLELIGNVNKIHYTRIKNSKQNEWDNEYAKKYGPLIEASNNYAQLSQTDTINRIAHQTGYDSVQVLMKDTLELLINLHPNSYAVFSAFCSRAQPKDFEWKKQLFPLFSEQIQNSKEGRKMFYELYKFNEDSIVGTTFPQVSVLDINQNEVLLHLHKDSIYLIDYWASWCIPCIKKIPELKKLYQSYHSKGFDIIALSLDAKYDKWINAINSNKIIWQNYSRLNGFETDDAIYFGIKSIPFTILVGKYNKVIKLNPTEEEVKMYLNDNAFIH